jgi:hypothetical protein
VNASSSKTLAIAVGGLGLLAVVAAASRAKAAQQAIDTDPELTPPGPPTPIRLPANTPPAAAEVVLPPPSLDPSTYPPGPPIPLPATPLQPASLDPMVEPPGPPIPLPSMPMVPVTALPAAPAPQPPAASMPLYQVPAPPAAAPTLPVKRPFGDQPLDVQATQTNVKPATNAAPTPAAKRAPKQAALDLLAYVTPILAQKRGSELGIKNKPNAVVKAAQLDMGDNPVDGIYGPRTREKGKQLTGKNFPARV